LTRIFIHAPPAQSRLVHAVTPLGNEPFKPLFFNRLHQHGESGLERTRISDRLRQLRQHLLFEEFAPFLEWLTHHVATGEHHHVEDVARAAASQPRGFFQ
jgi:hypothetical protein